MLSRPLPPLVPLEHRAADVLARATGSTLALWPDGTRHRPLPGAVTSVDHLDGATALGSATGSYDTVISIGQLGTTPDLATAIERIRRLLEPTSTLVFCEPTIASDEVSPIPPHDVTAALWRGGLTVFECRRFRAHHRLRTHEYCWGRARITPHLQ